MFRGTRPTEQINSLMVALQQRSQMFKLGIERTTQYSVIMLDAVLFQRVLRQQYRIFDRMAHRKKTSWYIPLRASSAHPISCHLQPGP
eukprot:6183609-Pyramimonas_sp.AAC.1